MSADRPSSSSIPQDPAWMRRLDENRTLTSNLLFAVAVVFGILAGFAAYKYGWRFISITVWAGLLAFLGVWGGVWIRLNENREVGGISVMRVLVITLGAIAGLATWLLSLALAYLWSAIIFGGVDAWQGPKWYQLWICALLLFGGLGVMFASLILGKAVERFNPILRRLLYGYNAALTGMMLLGILMIVNVLVYNYVTASWDWTESSIYTLSDKSKNILRGLEKPVRVYVIMPGGLRLNEVRNLLDNVRAINDKVRVDELSPDLEPDRVSEILRKYQVSEASRGGLLIVHGSDADAQTQFIKYEEELGRSADMLLKLQS